jgi:L-lactate dehydrogenase complex protein LldG
MPDSSSSRAAVLGSIRTALGVAALAAPEAIAAQYASIPRTYKRQGALDRTALLELFTHRLIEYDAGVSQCSPQQIGVEVSRLLTARGRTKIAIPEGLPAAWLPAGFEFKHATGLDAYQLDALDGVLTGCTVAIAETGSIVLQNAAAQGPRILSLVPDYHLCVVFPDQVVETVPESFDRLDATASLPTTFFSGPSATADIEMTRIKGVHGPRFLDVILVEQGTGQ